MTAAQAVSCYTRTENEMRKLKARCGWSWDPIVKMEAWSRGTDPIRKSKRMAEPTHYENELWVAQTSMAIVKLTIIGRRQRPLASIIL